MATRKKGRVSINDIAEKLKVSVSTVSRALNNHPKISDDTKSDVVRVAKELGYKPNMPEAFAQKPRRRKIGVVVPHLDKSIYVHALRGIEELAAQSDFSVIVSISHNNPKKELEILESFVDLGVEGVLISTAIATESVEQLQELVKSGVKVVSYNRISSEVPGGKVIVDNYHGAYIAVEHLISNGCKRIAYLSGDKTCPIYSERVKAFCDAHEHKALELDEDMLIHSELTRSDSMQFLEYAFSLPVPPDGLLVNDNMQALQSLAFLRNSGFNVPVDVAIVSFGSEEFNRYLMPAFTCVEFSGYSMGKKAVKLLLSEIVNVQKQSDLTLIESSKLVIRNTSIRS